MHTIEGLAKRRMVFDPDHLSVKARAASMDVIDDLAYPGVISSHSWSTPDAYPRIYRLGGTIMAYAGICGVDNIANQSDAFFHSASFDEIVAYTRTNTGNSCGVQTTTGNRAPVADADSITVLEDAAAGEAAGGFVGYAGSEARTSHRGDHRADPLVLEQRHLVDALGGVEVCVPEEVNDDVGNIYLPEGTYEATGKQALDYVRVRHSIGSTDTGDGGGGCTSACHICVT